MKLVYNSHPHFSIMYTGSDHQKTSRFQRQSGDRESLRWTFRLGFVMILIMGVNYWPNFQSVSGGRKRKGDPLSFLPTLPAVSVMPNLQLV